MFAKNITKNGDFLSAIIQFSQDAIISETLNGVITSWNPAAEKMFGYTANEAIGKPLAIISPPDRLNDYQDVIAKVKLGKSINHYETRQRKKDGTIIDVCVTVLPIKDKQDRLTGLSIFYRDISSQKQLSRYMRSLIESSLNPLLTLDATGKINGINIATIKMIGVPSEKIIGTDFSAYFTNPKKAREGFQLVLSNGFITNYPLTIHHSDGHLIEVIFNALAYKDIDGKILGVFAAAHDITEQKKIETEVAKRMTELEQNETATLNIMEDLQITLDELEHSKSIIEEQNQKLTESERRYRLISETSPSGIFEMDEHWICRYSNSKFRDIFGINYQQSDGIRLTDMLPIDNTNEVLKLGYNKCFSKTYRFIDKNRQIRWIQLQISPITDEHKKFTGTIQDISDIKNAEIKLMENTDELKIMNDELIRAQYEREEYVTELHKKTAELLSMNDRLLKSEKEILQKNIQLEKLDQLKSDFLNVTSHELRTPMSAIKGYIEMIQNQTLGPISEDQQNALNVILRNTDRLDNLIQDILDISRLESGTMKFVPEKTDIKKMIAETLETMQPAAGLKDIEIVSRVDIGLPELSIDNERIKQVLRNIINNAIKFSPQSSTITVRATKQDNTILFEIQDRGRGVPKDKQDKIFDIFYQVDSGMDRKFGGAGLGLAISRGIVLSHGGKIWLHSEGETGKGSSFFFTIPVTPIQDIEGKFREVDIFRLKNVKNEMENDSRNKTTIWIEETTM